MRARTVGSRRATWLRLALSLASAGAPVAATAAPLIGVYPASDAPAHKAAARLVHGALDADARCRLARGSEPVDALDGVVLVASKVIDGRAHARSEVFDRSGKPVLAREDSLESLREESQRRRFASELLVALVPGSAEAESSEAARPAIETAEEWADPGLQIRPPDSKDKSGAASAASCHGAPAAVASRAAFGTSFQYTRFDFTDGRGWYATTASQVDYSPLSWLSVQARMPLHLLQAVGGAREAGAGDAELTAKAKLVGEPGKSLVIAAGLTGMVPTGAVQKRLGMGHLGFGPVLAAVLPVGDLDLFAGVAGRFMVGGGSTHAGSSGAGADGAGGGTPGDAMPPEDPVPQPDPPPEEPPAPEPPPHQHVFPSALRPRGMTAGGASAETHLPYVGRHDRTELGYSAGLVYGRSHTLSATLNGTNVLAGQHPGEMLFTVRSEAKVRLATAVSLAGGVELPLTPERRFEVTAWSGLNCTF